MEEYSGQISDTDNRRKVKEMRVLFLPNWHVHKLEVDNDQWQAPDKYVKGQPYWFYRYFPKGTKVDVIDTHPKNVLSKLEHKLKFYIWQGFLGQKVMKHYDVVISHGAQSGLMIALLRLLFGKKGVKHIIFDIGGMNGGRTSGFSTKLIQFAMKSNPYIICHSTNIIGNLKKTYPWLVNRARFIPFGVGLYQYKMRKDLKLQKSIFVFSGKKRDEDTVANAWKQLVNEKIVNGYTLKFVGTKQQHDIPQTEDVRWLDYQDYTDALESSAFIILPLNEYPYSYGQMSLLGSLALGKYVIATDVTGISDYTTKCKSVLSVRPNDVEQMKDAIMKFIDDDVMSKDRSVPRKDIEMNFSEDKMGEKISEFVQDVVTSTPPQSHNYIITSICKSSYSIAISNAERRAA